MHTDTMTKRGLGHAACRAATAETADRASSPRSADSAYDQLQQWAQQAGIVAPKLRPAEFAGVPVTCARQQVPCRGLDKAACKIACSAFQFVLTVPC